MMDWKALGTKLSTWGAKLWDKGSMGMLKAFRGLLCEKKDGGWELSKGNTAFWIVLSHCMYVWAGATKAAAAVTDAAVGAATEAAAATTEAVTSAGETVADAGMLDSLGGMLANVGVGGAVPEQEFWLLMALLGYATVKTTKGGMTGALSAMRGK
jgi:hypothetical protein